MMTFSLGTGKVHSLAFSPTGDRLAVGIANRDVVLVGWPNTESRMKLTRQPWGAAAVRAITFSPDGQELACVYSNREVAFWDLERSAAPLKVWNTMSPTIEAVSGVWF